jgi:hypothetical protein
VKAEGPAPILAEESDDSVNTDNDSEGEVAAITIAETDGILAEAAADARFLAKGVSTGDDAIVPDEGVFINKISATAHMTNPLDDKKSACGIFMNPICFSKSSHEYALIGCTLCWRSGCAKWETNVSESLEDDHSQTETEGYAEPANDDDDGF